MLGTVRSADLLPAVLRGGAIQLRTLMREALFVPDSMRAFPLLEAFRSSHKHVAIVMDEFGAVEGLVTVTDLLEGLVGALPADATEARGAFVSRGDGSWLVEGRRGWRKSRRNSISRCRRRKPARITRLPALSWRGSVTSRARLITSSMAACASKWWTWTAGAWTRSW